MNNTRAAIPILRQLFAHLDADQEHFILLALNNKLKVTGYKIVSPGGMAGTVVDRRIVFRSALLLGATSVIVAHNQVHDHPILGRDVYSMAERGDLR